MLSYDWMWWGQLTNQNLEQRGAEVHGGAGRCEEVRRGVQGAQRCAEVHGGVQRCAEVCGGAWRCAEVFQRSGGGKNQDFMLIRFLNAVI